MLETSLLSIRIKVLIFYVIYLFVFVLWHYTQQEDFFDHERKCCEKTGHRLLVEGLGYLLKFRFVKFKF